MALVARDLPTSYARGVRQPYRELPAGVQRWVEAQLGGPVTSAEDRVGGFSPGCAAVVRSAGRSAFCKAVGDRPNRVSLQLYRRERTRLAALPDHPALPKPLAGVDLELPEGTWTVTLFPALPGQPPDHPWTEPVARLVFDRLGDLGRAFEASVATAPSPLEGSAELVGFFGRWAEVFADGTDPWACDPWVRASEDRLLGLDSDLQRQVVGAVPAHTDLRADNVLLGTSAAGMGGREVWFVDWAEARTAAAWVDPALLACDLVMSGADRRQGGSMDIWRFLARHPTTAGTDPDLHRGMLVGIAASLHRLSRAPDPPGLPTIRRWQERCADALLNFVRASDLGTGGPLW